jgi:hypothetical protein
VLRWYRVRAVRGLVRKLAHKKPQLLHKFFVTSAIKSVRRDAAAWPRINLVLLAAHASWRALPPWSRAAWSCRISDVSLVVVARCLLLPPPACSCLLLLLLLNGRSWMTTRPTSKAPTRSSSKSSTPPSATQCSPPTRAFRSLLPPPA